MPCNIIPKPWLTSHLNSAHWLTQLDLEISTGVSPYIQPIFIQVLTLEHQSNSTPCQFDWRRHFNPSTMLGLKGLWTCSPAHIQTRTYKNRYRKHGSMIKHYSKRHRHEYEPGDPRTTSRRALFYVKSRTLRALTTAFLLMEIMLSPWQLLSFFFIFIFIFWARCEDIHQFKTRYELRKELTLGYSHTSPTLGVCKTSSVWGSSLLL